MKYVLVLIDGAGDFPIEELGGKTPLQVAKIPTIDSLARHGEMGLVKTVPDTMSPGSDIANLSVLGYDPKIYHTGRSSLEALSMGIELAEDDVTLRCNLVTLSTANVFEERQMLDHSAGEITTAEAAELMEAVKEGLQAGPYKFYTGISYRHLLVWQEGSLDVELTPPHDIIGKEIAAYLPKGYNGADFTRMMKISTEILEQHPINLKRKELGINPANAIWFWGEGKRPNLMQFKEKYRLKGAMISAVDLLKGIARGSGMLSLEVPGATGTLHTNYAGKANAALKILDTGYDFVYIHIEAPDECGHQGDLAGKISAIENIDEKIVKPMLAALDEWGEGYNMLVLPDHLTPISTRTHARGAVPFVLYKSKQLENHPTRSYDEEQAQATGIFFKDGPSLFRHFVEQDS
ncbi:MAG: cofactor-independent phosphoglycerate mutase [Clostridia bacterium]